MTISSLPFLFLSVFFPRPCQLIINTQPGVETRSRGSRSSPFVWSESLCSQPRGPCPPCLGPNWNIWPVMSSQACYGLPTLSLWYFHNVTNCHCHPGERTNNTFLQSQVTQCKSRQVNSSWHSFKYWPWEPTLESVLVSSAESSNWSQEMIWRIQTHP